MIRGAEQTFLQRRNSDGQQTHENMLHVTNYQRNTNETHNEISPHTRRTSSKRQATTNVGEDMEKGAPSYTSGGNVS